MNNNSYMKLLQKQKKFEEIENLIDSFKESIMTFNQDKKISLDITIEVDEGGIMYFDYLGQFIRVLFINKIDSASIEFLLEKPNKHNNGFIYDKVVTVDSDNLGNLKSKEVGFERQLYQNVHYDILNFIIESATDQSKPKGGFVNI